MDKKQNLIKTEKFLKGLEITDRYINGIVEDLKNMEEFRSMNENDKYWHIIAYANYTQLQSIEEMPNLMEDKDKLSHKFAFAVFLLLQKLNDGEL